MARTVELTTPDNAIAQLNRVNQTVVGELRRINKIVLADYRKLLRTTRTDDIDAGNLDDYVQSLVARYGQWFAKNEDTLARSIELVEKTARAGNAVRFNAKMRQALNRKGQAVVYPDLSIIAEEGISKRTSRAWQFEQLDLIKKDGSVGPNGVPSIPQKHFERLQEIVQRSVHGGDSWEDLRAQLVELDGVDERRAEVIARDQTNKYNAGMTQERSKSLGITHYIWRTVGDDSVRDEHRARNGRRFAYDDPPRDGPPGVPVQCRCYADPDFDEALSRR